MTVQTMTNQTTLNMVTRRATMTASERAREDFAQLDRYEGTCEWQAATDHTITSEADALSAGVNYVSAWQQAEQSKREAHAWNTLGHIESDQPYATLHALACAQQVDHYDPTTGQWTTEYLTISRTGRVTTDKYNRTRKSSTSAAGRKSSRAVREDGAPMTAAERKRESRANSKWRAEASEAGYVCPDHGPVSSKCVTPCRQRALGLQGHQSETVAVATASERDW